MDVKTTKVSWRQRRGREKARGLSPVHNPLEEILMGCMQSSSCTNLEAIAGLGACPRKYAEIGRDEEEEAGAKTRDRKKTRWVVVDR